MVNAVDGTNPAPLRMPQMLVLSQYHDLSGHPEFVPINPRPKPLVRLALSGSPSVFLQTAADVARGFRVSETASFPIDDAAGAQWG